MKLKARATHKAGKETSVASLSLAALVVKEPRGSFWGILPALGRAKGDPIESTSWWGLLEMQRGQKRFRSHPGLLHLERKRDRCFREESWSLARHQGRDRQAEYPA